MKKKKIEKFLDKNEKMEEMVHKHIESYNYDYYSSVLVMKHTFYLLEDIIEADEMIDNALIQFYDDFKKFISIQPLSLVFISHDEYEKIELEEIILYENRLQTKFFNLMNERFLEQ